MLKILFVIPGISRDFFDILKRLSSRWQNWKHLNRDLSKHYRNARRVFYGSGIITIAGLLDSQEYDVKVIDENFENLNFDEHYDIVALSGQLIQTERMIELCDIYRKKGTYVIIGGAMVTLYENEFTQEGVSVFVGEGEDLFKNFLADFKEGTPLPVYKNKTNVFNKEIRSVMPRYDLISRYRYNLIGVQTTRGCPYRCEYCNVAYLLGDKYRHKAVEQVLEEILLVKKYWPDSMFYFLDDNLFADRKYAYELFEAINGKVNLGVYGTHADLTIYRDKTLLKLLTDVGEPVLAFGFETLDIRNKEFIKNEVKTNLIPLYPVIVKELHSHGIKITGSFMFGFNGDDLQYVDKVMNFVKENEINAYFTVYSVTPKSTLFNKMRLEYERQNHEKLDHRFHTTKLLNRKLLKNNNFILYEMEEMILKGLKKAFPEKIVISRMEGIAVNYFYNKLGML